jgi:molybdate transport system regulatory protein
MPRLCIELTLAGGTMVGPSDVLLLEEIARRGSLSAASRALAIPYWKTWRRVKELNRSLDEPIVEADLGGRGGGSAALTCRGYALVSLYRVIERDARRATRDLLYGHGRPVTKVRSTRSGDSPGRST